MIIRNSPFDKKSERLSCKSIFFCALRLAQNGAQNQAAQYSQTTSNYQQPCLSEDLHTVMPHLWMINQSAKKKIDPKKMKYKTL